MTTNTNSLQTRLPVAFAGACVLLLMACGGSDTTPPTDDTDTATPTDIPTPPEDTASPPPKDTSPPPDNTTPPTPVKTEAFVVQVPSSGAGENGVAVRVMPPAGEPRYAEGAPIAIAVSGGWSSGSFGSSEKLGAHQHGVIVMEFLYPGGASKDGQYQSGGEYDVRGPNCHRAVADVARWAMGLVAAQDGTHITDHLPYALTEEVGLLGSSNGGNAVLTALGAHGEDTLGVRWFAGWESPIGDQFAAVELNGNPFYEPGSCGPIHCPTPGLAQGLSWDPNGSTKLVANQASMKTGKLLLAGSGGANGLFTRFTAGYDENGTLTGYPSQELGEAIREAQDTLGDLPDWLETSEDALAAYWQHRDGALHIATIASQMPDLLVMHLQNSQDHVQSQPDHPHAMAHLQGWESAGHAWWRLNPDASYMAAVTTGVGPNAAFPDNDANTPLVYPGGEPLTVPKGVSKNVSLAAVLELSDRVHAQDLSANLSDVLFAVESVNSEAETPPANGNPGLTCQPGQTSKCCGDGVCDGPENAQNCPADCGA